MTIMSWKRRVRRLTLALAGWLPATCAPADDPACTCGPPLHELAAIRAAEEGR